MKKVIIGLAAVVCTLTAFAQNNRSNDPYVPRSDKRDNNVYYDWRVPNTDRTPELLREQRRESYYPGELYNTKPVEPREEYSPQWQTGKGSIYCNSQGLCYRQ